MRYQGSSTATGSNGNGGNRVKTDQDIVDGREEAHNAKLDYKRMIESQMESHLMADQPVHYTTPSQHVRKSLSKQNTQKAGGKKKKKAETVDKKWL